MNKIDGYYIAMKMSFKISWVFFYENKKHIMKLLIKQFPCFL